MPHISSPLFSNWIVFFFSISKLTIMPDSHDVVLMLQNRLSHGFNEILPFFSPLKIVNNFMISLPQHTRIAQGKIARCGEEPTWEREFRILRISKASTTTRRNNQPTRQSVDHSTHHELLETSRFLSARRSNVDEGKQSTQ